MSFYQAMIFLHVIGAAGIFAAVGVEIVSMRNLRRTETGEQARQWLSAMMSLRRLSSASLLTILISGIYMTAAVWKMTGWIVIAFIALVLLAVTGGALTGPRMAKIGKAVGGENGPLTGDTRQLIYHPFVWISLYVRTAILAGIVFLMTVKPGFGGALLTMVVSIILGFAASIPLLKNTRLNSPGRSEKKAAHVESNI